MHEPIKLPDPVRLDLVELQAAVNQTQTALNAAGRLAFRFLGLDPSKPHQLDLATGIVTPFEPEKIE